MGEWRQVSSTALSAGPMAVVTYPPLGNTGPSSKIVAWTGFAVDTRDSSVYSAANGGHADYAGNEVNRIRLSDNVPAWTEARTATPASQVVASVTHYADGRPSSRHSYYGAWVNEVRGRTMLIGGSPWGIGFGSGGVVDGFNIGAADWDTAGTYPTGPGNDFDSVGFAVVDQKSTGDVFVFSNYSVLKWSNATNAWTKRLSNTSIYGQYSASAFDTKRNRAFVVGGNANAAGLYDVAANTLSAVTLTGPNAGSLADSGNGMVYDVLLDAYLLKTGAAGGTIYRINAQTFAVDTLTTTGSASVPATSNGVWRRFLYVPALKGVVYFPTYQGNLWFLRTN